MSVNIEPSWHAVLAAEFEKPYFVKLTQFVKQEVQNGYAIYPPGKKIFAAFDACPFQDVKVVIIGQDPYHGPGQANGLCFSVNDGIALPPSLKNIYKEIADDLGIVSPQSGDLQRWAKQGVLLLNATLTVRANSPGSHQNQGWETFTDAVIEALNAQKTGLVFILWGSYAQRKGSIIDKQKHLVLESAHPSPFSVHRGFFGCRHFSKTNQYLKDKGLPVISW